MGGCGEEDGHFQGLFNDFCRTGKPGVPKKCMPRLVQDQKKESSFSEEKEAKRLS